MKIVAVSKFAGALAVVVGLLGGGAAAQDAQLSDKTVDAIARFALATIPSEIKEPDGTVITIDKDDPQSILIPIEDARSVIQVARLSAHAQLCDLPQLQVQNYLTMMRQERARDKWTKEQLLFINRLHLFTVMWLSGNVKFVDKGDGSQEPEVVSEPQNQPECSEEDRKQVQSRIESYLKSAKKS